MSKWNKTILIVEDDESQKNLLISTFLANRFKVEYAQNGIKALESLSKSVPDAIILDLVMPEMDGYELCAELKNGGQYKEIPIIVLSAIDNDENKEKLMSMGASNYISKPYSPARLVEVVSKLI